MTLLMKGVSEEYTSVPKQLYRHTSDRIMAYGWLMSANLVFTRAQDWPISLFLTNFVAAIIRSAPFALSSGEVELLRGGSL